MRIHAALFCGLFFAAVLCACPAWCLELDESPAEEGSWGYRPDDGAAVNLNPPPFTWRPIEDAAAYAFEIAVDTDFKSVVYTCAKTPWNAHCPAETLPSGTYFWRYAAVDQDGQATAWSRVRSFSVGPEAVAFPMPPLPELLDRIPAEHPKLFLRPEEVQDFQTLAQGSLAERWNELRASADKLLSSPPDTSEPPKYPEGTTRLSKEWKKIWWGNRTHGIAVANGAATLAFVYRLTGEQKYGEGARDLMMALCAWDPKGSTQYEYNDEAAMPLLYYPSRAYTWAYDIFTPEERAKIVAMMRVRGADCYDHLQRRKHLWFPYASHSNRAWHWLGEVAIAFQGDIPEAGTWLDYAVTIFYTCYPVWGGRDGGWHEGMAYWNSYVSRFLYWAQVSQSALRINPFEKPFYKHAGDWGLYVLPPGTKTGGFADLAPWTGSSNVANLMSDLAAASGNPYWQWYADQHKTGLGGYAGFIQAARTQHLEAKAPTDLPSSKVFRDVGIAAMNTNLLDGTNNAQILFKSSPMGRQSHGYNANNAFLLHLNGERALLRTGRRDVYGSPHHREWIWETKSDNAILVDGQGQIPHSLAAKGEITYFDTSDELDVAVGEAGASYTNLDRWTRRIFFFKPGAILIHDILEAPKPSSYTWLLHAEKEFRIGENTAALELENGSINTQFLYPEGLKITQKNTFDTPPHEWATFKLDEWHLSADTPDKAQTQEFLTLLTLRGAKAIADTEKTEEGFKVRLELETGIYAVDLGRDVFTAKPTE